MKRYGSMVILLLVLFSIAPLARVQAAPSCTEEVVVQTNDWLSKIADKYYNDPLAYEVIFQATNEWAAEDTTFVAIEDADLIEPGWKLCIVSPEVANTMLDQDLTTADEATTTSTTADETTATTTTTAADDAAASVAETTTTSVEDSDTPVQVGLQLIADGLTSPVALIPSPDDTGRLFVVDQVGTIQVLTAEGDRLPEAFLDIHERMVPLSADYDERGLLGLAFHPDFATNGRFFVYYSAPLREGVPTDWDHTSRISEFTVAADNPNLADPASERIVMEIDKPQGNHNGGQIAFGPDGHLYIPIGDGGAANDVAIGHSPIGNGQDTTNLLGSILRIDVNNGEPYGIPTDNPFVRADDGFLDEIFAYGFRNPYRIAFDQGGNQSLFVSDAGQDQWEEVNVVTAGNNYGWNIKEGAHCFDASNPGTSPAECATSGANGEPLVDPIIEYQNANVEGGLGLVVVGGFVYRGEAMAELDGYYIFGDWSTSPDQSDGTLFAAEPAATEGELWSMEPLQISTTDDGKLNAYVLSFGQDAAGEIYVLTTNTPGPSGTTGQVFKLVPPENIP